MKRFTAFLCIVAGISICTWVITLMLFESLFDGIGRSLAPETSSQCSGDCSKACPWDWDSGGN
jgi:hypothetical protein